jgi:DNA-binding response OmpR family regulator
MSMKRILLVDDEPHVIRVMRLALQRCGYEIDEASNGEMALERIRQCEPHVMITDIDMPRMNGEQLCKEISRQMPDRKFAIIVLTARTELEHRVWSSKLEDLMFMEKPVSIRRLIERLNIYFSETAGAGDVINA